MGRKKANRVFTKIVRVSDELHRHLELAQREEKDAIGVEPKLGQLMDRIWEASGGSPLRPQLPDFMANISNETRKSVELLAQLLESESPLRDIILPALDLYANQQAKKPPKPSTVEEKTKRRKVS